MRLRYPLLLLCGLLLFLQPDRGFCEYPGLHNDALADPSFCPYGPNSPWRQKLPDQPRHKRPSSEWTIARNYSINSGQTGSPFWSTNYDNEYAGYNPPYTYPGRGGMPTFMATTADHPVTFRCECQHTNYGGMCWEGDVNVCSANPNGGWEHTGYAPTDVFAGVNYGEGDANWAIVQPNGDVVEGYGCQIHQTISNGALFSSNAVEGVCDRGGANWIGGMLWSNLSNGLGINGAINSGPNAMAIGLKYAHTVPPATNPQNMTPNQAIWMNTSCNGNGFVYPATSGTRPCDNPSDGLDTGAHLWLNMSRGQIDSVIASNPALAPWRGVLYAAKEYGMYLGDTGCGYDASIPRFGCGWLENATHVVLKGNHNLWLDWPPMRDSPFNPNVYYNPFFIPEIRNNLEVIDDCYAYPYGHGGDNCSADDDRVPQETTGCAGVTTTAPQVTITAPNGGNNVTVGTTPLTTLAGNATDDVGVTQVTWACPSCPTTGGAATCLTCGPTATAPTWTVGSIPLAVGVNTITVTARDADNQTGIDTIQVTYSPAATPELVARYQFDGNPNDTSGKGNHLTLTGGPTYTSTGGTYGQGLQLNGSTQYAEAASSASLNLTTALTLAGWVRPSQQLAGGPSNPAKPVVMKSFVYWLFANSSPSECGGLAGPWAGVWRAGTWYNVCTTTALPNGQWTHLAATLSTNGTLTFYRNGTVTGTPLTNVPLPIDINAVGTLQVGGDPNPGEQFPGILEEVRVYNYALNATEIAALATPVPGTAGIRRPKHRSFMNLK